MLHGISRRLFCSSLAAATASAWMPTRWLRDLAAAQETDASPIKNVVLLWLHGGPATIDLWDLKPNHDNGGPFREIATRTPGMKISEHLPNLAHWSEEMTLVRSMTTREGDHGRAVHLARTGYVPQAGIDFPDMGALVSKEFHQHEGRLPGFVSIAPPLRPAFSGSGFLGTDHAPMVVGENAKSVGDLKVDDLRPYDALPKDHFAARRELLSQMDAQFLGQHASQVGRSYQATTDRAFRLMHPDAVAAFDLEQESKATRDRYQQTTFGQGCLLARRLVERGVSFVEVTLGGWDTHTDNFGKVQSLSGQLDSGFSSLLSDLKDRGLLSSTLVICMGEFGRTPKINGNTGRDHWPRAWSVALAGGGVGNGQVIGQTSADGTTVEEQPCAVPDLLATVAYRLGIDPLKQNPSNVNRPIRIADPEANLIEELI